MTHRSMRSYEQRWIERNTFQSSDDLTRLRNLYRQRNDTNPRQFKEYARKIGTSVQMLMDNYAQVPDNKDKEEYKGVGDLSSDEEEEEKPMKRTATHASTKIIKKAKK